MTLISIHDDDQQIPLIFLVTIRGGSQKKFIVFWHVSFNLMGKHCLIEKQCSDDFLGSLSFVVSRSLDTKHQTQKS